MFHSHFLLPHLQTVVPETLTSGSEYNYCANRVICKSTVPKSIRGLLEPSDQICVMYLGRCFQEWRAMASAGFPPHKPLIPTILAYVPYSHYASLSCSESVRKRSIKNRRPETDTFQTILKIFHTNLWVHYPCGVFIIDLKGLSRLINHRSAASYGSCTSSSFQSTNRSIRIQLTLRKTPTTARPSGLVAASPKLGYLVFQ